MLRLKSHGLGFAFPKNPGAPRRLSPHFLLLYSRGGSRLGASACFFETAPGGAWSRPSQTGDATPCALLCRAERLEPDPTRSVSQLEFSWLLVFGAGVLSFLSPCVLPLVPPYLTYMSGASF